VNGNGTTIGSRALLMIAYTNYMTDPRVIRAAEAAAEAGFEVDVIALRRAGEVSQERVRGVRVIRLRQERYRGRSRIKYALAYVQFFIRCLVLSSWLHVRRRYDIVHVHNMPDVLVFSAVIPWILGAKIVLDIHDPMPETFDAKYAGGSRGWLYSVLLAMERVSVAFAHRTITVNEPVRDVVLLKHGYRRDAIDVIANFADDRVFKTMPYPPINGRVRFVFHGTILARYGLRTLVEAVARVQHRDRIQVRIIGEGDFSGTLRQLISTHGMADVIEFRNCVYPMHEIPAALSDCHVGIVPLDITPISDVALPLKLIEYTCLGLPSITVESTAITHYFRPEECMLYPPGNVTALASLIDAIAQAPGRLDAYRMRLPQVRERLSWRREKGKYVAMLRAMADLPPMLESEVAAAQERSSEA
jgi:glycosyltransferase involved in cell wall biosynthesis